MYYSQYGQDKYLDNEIFNGKQNGIFVDVGAHDGILGSNTYFFEKSRGWSGICIEANPVAYEELRRNRSCICVDYAISNFRGTARFLKIEGYGKRLCGLYDKYHKKHIKRIADEVKQHNSRTELIEVQCLTLNDVLTKYELYTDFSRLISAPLYRGNLGTRFRTHTGFLPQFARLDFPTMKLDSVLHLFVV